MSSGHFEPSDFVPALARAATLAEPTRKFWTPATLERMAVGMDATGRYVFRIEDAAGAYVGTVRYSDAGQEPKMRADPGSKRDLWPAPEVLDGPTINVVEGEPDAVSMAELGRPAVAIPGVGKDDPGWPARIARGRNRVVCWPDADKVGRKRMRDMAKAIAATGVEAAIIDIGHDRDDGYDVGDLLVERGEADARAVLSDAESFATPIEPEPVKTGDGRVAVVLDADRIPIKSVGFLWRPWIPLGKVTVLAGAPGQGKSQLSAFFAANTTRRAFEPSDVRKPGKAVILTAEDDLADTVVPRLIAAGADLSLVKFVVMRRTMPDGLTVDGLIRLPGDVQTLRAILERGDVRLVIFDPVASFVGREHSTYVNQDVRDMLDPVVALAAQYDVAIVLILHLNKSEAKSWAQKIGESHAFQAVARTILALAPDPDDEDGESGTDKVLAATKLNLVRSVVPALKLRVVPTTVYTTDMTPVETSQIEIVSQVSMLADDLLADATERGARREALEFLLDVLSAGAMESKALKAAAKDAHVSWRSIERCYRELCKPAKPAKLRGPWVYELQPRYVPTHTLGELDGLSSDDDAESAKIARGVSRDSENATSDNGQLDGLSEYDESDNVRYLRERDRRLGESWDE